MPQFTYDPNNPEAVVANVATGGDVFGQKRETPAPSGGSTSTTTAPASAPKKKKKKKKKPEKPTTPAYNPFTAPFKTPAELRAEAARLAALGSPTEQSLREQQQREEAGLTGLTTATAGALQNILGETQAGLRAFGDVYGRVGAGVTSAAESALAAAGAPTSVAPTVSEADRARLGSQLAAYSAPLLGLPGAAAATGQRLIGASQANLAKALAQRASQISSDTAKYLRQLQQEEIDRAIAQTTAEQNAARLALSEQGQQFEQQVDMANLGLRGQTVQQGWARIDQQLQQDIAKAGKDRRKKIQSAKDSILENIKDWTGTQTVSTGEGVYDVTVDMGLTGGGPKAVQVVATSPEAARQIAQNTYQNRPVSSVIFVRENQIQRAPTAQEIRRTLVARLVNAGMKRKAATQWVNANVVSVVSPSAVGTGGAFMGGVV